jgi:hypothetical protein
MSVIMNNPNGNPIQIQLKYYNQKDRYNQPCSMTFSISNDMCSFRIMFTRWMLFTSFLDVSVHGNFPEA